MHKNLLIILLKVVCTLVLAYSAFMMLFASIYDWLSMSAYMSVMSFVVEKIIPHASAMIALVFLIRRIWMQDKEKSDSNSIKIY